MQSFLWDWFWQSFTPTAFQSHAVFFKAVGVIDLGNRERLTGSMTCRLRRRASRVVSYGDESYQRVCWQRDCKQRLSVSDTRGLGGKVNPSAPVCVRAMWNIKRKWNVLEFGVLFIRTMDSICVLSLVFMSPLHHAIVFCLLMCKHIMQHGATSSNLARIISAVELTAHLLGFSISDWTRTTLKMVKFCINRFNHLTDDLLPESGQSGIAAQSPSALSSLLIFKIWLPFSSAAT